MALKYLREQRQRETVAEVARVMFPYPGPEGLDMETVVNVPTPRLSVGKDEAGKDIFPDIVVVGRPGQFLRMMAQVESPDTVNDESALSRWLPCSRVGDLLIYVPSGMAGEARQLCKRHGVRPLGIRTWRFRPVWGLDVTKA